MHAPGLEVCKLDGLWWKILGPRSKRKKNKYRSEVDLAQLGWADRREIETMCEKLWNGPIQFYMFFYSFKFF